jgi:hypothetical protein
MRDDSSGRDPILEELHSIRGTLQDLMILECARTGMKREDLRRIVPVDKSRISRIMKHVKKTKRQAHGGDDAP